MRGMFTCTRANAGICMRLGAQGFGGVPPTTTHHHHCLFCSPPVASDGEWLPTNNGSWRAGGGGRRAQGLPCQNWNLRKRWSHRGSTIGRTQECASPHTAFMPHPHHHHHQITECEGCWCQLVDWTLAECAQVPTYWASLWQPPPCNRPVWYALQESVLRTAHATVTTQKVMPAGLRTCSGRAEIQ